jgi:ABC-type dipeptide/oligopeptide/nickel transport system permease subunit
MTLAFGELPVPERRWRAMLRRYSRRRLGWIGATIVALAVVLAVFAPLIATHDPVDADFANVHAPPSREHWLGTDQLGRDIYSRVVYGSRVSLRVGCIAIVIAVGIGLPLGLMAGYSTGWIDHLLIMRVMDAMMAFPPLVLALVIVVALGPSINNALIAIGVTYSPGFARLVRGTVLSLREEPYVDAARALGASAPRIIIQHILPNLMSPVIVLASLGLAGAILAEAGLSFLGVGAQPPTPAWGSMLNSGRQFIETNMWESIAPGTAIMLVVMGFNFVGDSLRDALDPRLRA